MAKRKIIKIDEKKCNGCAQCIPSCPEGALQVIDGKVRLISDLFCDGLGACIGYCPQGAITIEEREATPYDEKKVMANVIKGGKNVIKAHLLHLKGHNQSQYFKEAIDFLKEKEVEVPNLDKDEHLPGLSGCPGSKIMELKRRTKPAKEEGKSSKGPSQLSHWPVQLKLVPSIAPFLKDADLLIAADCVPFAYADFHHDLLKGKILLVGCPKLDDVEFYRQKITQILKDNNIRSITCAHMEVPCCFGLVEVVREALEASGDKVPFREITIGINGEKQ